MFALERVNCKLHFCTDAQKAIIVWISILCSNYGFLDYVPLKIR